jgi:hypothetical protein
MPTLAVLWHLHRRLASVGPTSSNFELWPLDNVNFPARCAEFDQNYHLVLHPQRKTGEIPSQ